MGRLEYIKNNLNTIIQQKKLTNEGVLMAMLRMREIIEVSPSELNYSILNFYCDWSFHTDIDRNKTGHSILSKLSKYYILESNNSKISNYFGDAILTALKFHLLFEQIIHLGSFYRISALKKFNQDSFKQYFLKLLIENLYFKRNMFPTDGRSLIKNKIYCSMESNAKIQKNESIFLIVGMWFKYDTLKNEQVIVLENKLKQYVICQITFLSQKKIENIKMLFK